jgi:hypothetical protein
MASTKAPVGSHLRSDWTTVAPWFSKISDSARPTSKSRCQKRSWQGGPEGYISRQ